jgi:hypothetical protein
VHLQPAEGVKHGPLPPGALGPRAGVGEGGPEAGPAELARAEQHDGEVAEALVDLGAQADPGGGGRGTWCA